MNTAFVVVDDFLPDPDRIRALALDQSYVKMGSAGKRSDTQFLETLDSKLVESLLDLRIPDWGKHAVSGRFQFCTSEDPLVYHCDYQTHAATIYLTPGAPIEAGLSLWRSKCTKARRIREDQGLFAQGHFDPTPLDLVDRIGNRYNRLVIWDGSLVHSASCYFGQRIDDARLFQMFFFDAESR